MLHRNTKEEISETKASCHRPTQSGNQQKATNTKSKPKSEDDRHAELMDLLGNIKAQNNDTKTEITSFKRSIDSRLKSVDSVVMLQVQRVSNIERKIETMESQMNAVKYERELNKQQQLKNNISIHGLPNIDAENVTNTALMVFATIGLKFNNSDIISAYRTSGAAISTRSIIVKFADFKHKLSVLEVKTKKPVTVNNVVLTNSKTDQFI